MNGSRRPFDHSELPVDPADAAPAELIASLAAGRELEEVAGRETVTPSSGFTDRVMAAIEAEPAPQPVGIVARAIRRRQPVALLGGLRDAWRVAWSSGRPALVRAQAIALVLVVAVALGSVGGIATVGALGILNGTHPSPSNPTVTPSPVPRPSQPPSVEPSPPPSSSDAAEPSDSAEPSETPEPTETTEAGSTGDHFGSGATLGTETPEPGGTDDHGGSSPTDDHAGASPSDEHGGSDG